MQAADTDSEERVGLLPVMNLVCSSLLEMGYTWEFNVMLSNVAHIDGNLMLVQGTLGERFYISFYKATAEVPKLAGFAYYAVGFIVQKDASTSHLRHFDAISIAYDAIIRRALSATKDSAISEATQMTTQLVDRDRMQAELLILKNNSI